MTTRMWSRKTGRMCGTGLVMSGNDNSCEVVGLMNELAKGAYGQLRNYFHASLKLERKERNGGDPADLWRGANTPGAGAGQRGRLTAQTKQRLRKQKAGLNPFALKQAWPGA